MNDTIINPPVLVGFDFGGEDHTGLLVVSPHGEIAIAQELALAREAIANLEEMQERDEKRLEDLEAEVEHLRQAAETVVKDIDALVANSEGVAGLHMNGEVADWESLMAGGSFGAWLQSVEVLRQALHQSLGEGNG